jgi:DNA-binding winged helix-turn-helix (wHTH) protein/WD40 repeat protein
MMGNKSFVFRFDDVEVHEREFSLVKAGKALAVEPKAFRALLFLLHNPQRLISKEDLLNSVWGDAAVTEGSLTRCIWLLRRTLGDDTNQPRYIETVATVGYRFVCKVEVSEDGLGNVPWSGGVVEVNQNGGILRAVAEPETQVQRATHGETVLASEPGSRVRKSRRLLVSAIAAMGLAGAVWYLQRPLPPPRVTGYNQITHDGRSKGVGGTDGTRLYFSYISPPSVAQVGVNGGEIVPLPITVPGVDNFLVDLSRDGSNTLIQAFPSNSLWIVPLLGGHARRLGKGRGAFSPDSTSVVYSENVTGEIFVVHSDGSEPRRLAPPGPFASDLGWSPDGKVIRFNRSGLLWEMASDGSGLHQLLPGWHEQGVQCCGNWTPNGPFYVFNLTSPSTRSQIWALDERHGLIRRPPSLPTALTTGPIRWGAAIPSRDGKKIFADGVTPRGEASRIDPKTGGIQPILGGISAEFVTYSSDGKAVAYVSFPEGVLWKADQDGSNRIQLTSPPIVAVTPRWSPDSKQIVFSDFRFQSQEIYVVSPEGGSLQKLLPKEYEHCLDANWSPDGTKVVFAWERLPTSERELRILDLPSQRIDAVPGSTGVFSPRWSPDGRYIAALTRDASKLEIFDLKMQRWMMLVADGGERFPSFSRDSRFIYFLRAGRDQGVFRIPVTGGKPERVADLRDFHLTGVYGFSMSLDPTDAPMVLRDAGSDDIYALTLEE